MGYKTSIKEVILRSGEDGATFTPGINDSGYLYWTNDKGLQNPPPFKLNDGVTPDYIQRTYTLVDTPYYTSGKINVIKIGNLCLMSTAWNVLDDTMPDNTIIGKIDSEFIPVSRKLITAPTSGGFTYFTVDENGDVIFYNGDKGKTGGKHYNEFMYSLF